MWRQTVPTTVETKNLVHKTKQYSVSGFSPAYTRHVGPASLQYRFFFDVGRIILGECESLECMNGLVFYDFGLRGRGCGGQRDQ